MPRKAVAKVPTSHPAPALHQELRELILAARERVAQMVNAGLTLLYWQVGDRIRREVLKGKRATYGEEIVSALATQLTAEFGQGFGRRNLFRMIRFAEVFPDAKIVSALLTQLGWTHFTHIIRLDDPLKREFYAEMCRIERWSTRGHMASNLEMKGHGDDNAGMQSQQESFSFANVCPQMQGHNAPLWSSLEGDCLELAAKLGRVAVFTGPVYRTTDDEQLPTTDAPKGKCNIPIPTHFYKIIIATVDGHTEALGFLIPHQADLKADQRFDFAVSVRKIEKAAGINFMPALGANDDVENHPSDELLDLLQKN
ncbi:MAG: DUF1016 N-terminal domain-containing protein [Bryobacteraceae bacterium]|nr:DUF1016 N-terminal domain-containing protein [Bryobacteraceae bacterium]